MMGCGSFGHDAPDVPTQRREGRTRGEREIPKRWRRHWSVVLIQVLVDTPPMDTPPVDTPPVDTA